MGKEKVITLEKNTTVETQSLLKFVPYQMQPSERNVIAILYTEGSALNAYQVWRKGIEETIQEIWNRDHINDEIPLDKIGFLELMKGIQKERNIKFITYPTIQDILSNMEAAGWVMMRQDKPKSDKLYYLGPEMREKLREYFTEMNNIRRDN
jgi:DNA-binding MarR family transcriptional regulator